MYDLPWSREAVLAEIHQEVLELGRESWEIFRTTNTVVYELGTTHLFVSVKAECSIYELQPFRKCAGFEQAVHSASMLSDGVAIITAPDRHLQIRGFDGSIGLAAPNETNHVAQHGSELLVCTPITSFIKDRSLAYPAAQRGAFDSEYVVLLCRDILWVFRRATGEQLFNYKICEHAHSMRFKDDYVYVERHGESGFYGLSRHDVIYTPFLLATENNYSLWDDNDRVLVKRGCFREKTPETKLDELEGLLHGAFNRRCVFVTRAFKDKGKGPRDFRLLLEKYPTFRPEHLGLLAGLALIKLSLVGVGLCDRHLPSLLLLERLAELDLSLNAILEVPWLLRPLELKALELRRCPCLQWMPKSLLDGQSAMNATYINYY